MMLMMIYKELKIHTWFAAAAIGSGYRKLQASKVPPKGQALGNSLLTSAETSID